MSKTIKVTIVEGKWGFVVDGKKYFKGDTFSCTPEVFKRIKRYEKHPDAKMKFTTTSKSDSTPPPTKEEVAPEKEES